MKDIINDLESCYKNGNDQCDGVCCYGCWKDIVRKAIKDLEALSSTPIQAVVPTDSDWRQKLFDYMDKEHDVQLLDSDMNEIQHICFPPDYPYVVSPVKQEAEDADICDILFKFYHEIELTSNKDDLKYVYEKYVKAIRYLPSPVKQGSECIVCSGLFKNSILCQEHHDGLFPLSKESDNKFESYLREKIINYIQWDESKIVTVLEDVEAEYKQLSAKGGYDK